MGISAQDLLQKLRAEQEQQQQRPDARALLEQLRAQQQNPSAIERASQEATGAIDTALTMATGAGGFVAGGLHGLYDLVAGKGVNQAAQDIQSTQEALTWAPKTPEAQRNIEGLGHGFEYGKRLVEGGIGGGYELARGRGVDAAADTISQIRERGAGDVVMERTGNAGLATLANMGVDVALLVPQVAGLAKPSTSNMPRTKLTGSEKELLGAIEADAFPETLSQFRGAAKKRDQQINVLRDAEKKAAELGPEATVGDVAGPNVRGLQKTYGAVSSTGKQLREGVVERGAKVRERQDAVLEETLFKGRKFKEAVDSTEEATRTQAAPLYRESWAHEPVVTPELKSVLREPVMADAIPEAIKLLKAEPTITKAEYLAGKRGLTVQQKAKAKKMFKVDRQAGSATPGIRKKQDLTESTSGKGRSGINVDALDSIGLDFLKRGMDQLTGILAKNEGRSQQAGAMAIQTGNLRKAIEAQNPTYGEALSVWSTGKKAVQAAEDGQNAFKSLASGTKSAETLIDEFNSLNAGDKALYRIGAADYLRSKIQTRPDLKSGETPSSVHTTFAGSPAHRELLKSIFEDTGSYDKFMKLVNREKSFDDTLRAVNIGDDVERSMQHLYSAGKFAEQISRMSTDALYSFSGNRYAQLSLIQNAIMHPKQFLRKFNTAEAARLSLGQNAQSTIREMLNVLEAKQAINGPAVNGMAKKMARVAKMHPKKMYTWLKDEKHRRQLYALGTAAAVAEQSGAKENGK